MKNIRTMNRRRVVQAIAIALACSGGNALAQAWPNKPISLVVPFPAPGSVC